MKSMDKQEAIAVVKEYGKRQEVLDSRSMTDEEAYEFDKIQGVCEFLIDRFEITEEDLECQE